MYWFISLLSMKSIPNFGKKKKLLFFSNTPPFWNIEVGLSEIWMAKNIG